MVTEVQYTSIHRILDNLLDHPMLRDLTLEQVVRYTMRFIARHGYSKFYLDKVAPVEIHQWRALLPCDLVSVVQVKDMKTGICLRSMTDNFGEGFKDKSIRFQSCKDPMNNVKPKRDWYIPEMHSYGEEPSFKTQDRVIYTSFAEGLVEIAYKATPVDDDGFPMIIDNEVYLDALEYFIKSRVFQIKFDQGKIAAPVLQEAKQEYAVAAKLLQSEFTTPSVSEMRSIASMWNTMIPKMREFDNGFRDLGNREYLKKV